MHTARNYVSMFGYSLIEMLVVISIMGILLSVGVASYRQFDDRAKADETARILVAELRSIQKEANSGVSSCVSSVANPQNALVGKRVTIIPGTPLQPIRVTDMCQDRNGVPNQGPDVTLPRDPLKSALTLNVIPNVPFTFFPLNKGLDTDVVNVEVGNTAKTVTITISEAGGISVSQ